MSYFSWTVTFLRLNWVFFPRWGPEPPTLSLHVFFIFYFVSPPIRLQVVKRQNKMNGVMFLLSEEQPATKQWQGCLSPVAEAAWVLTSYHSHISLTWFQPHPLLSISKSVRVPALFKARDPLSLAEPLCCICLPRCLCVWVGVCVCVCVCERERERVR